MKILIAGDTHGNWDQADYLSEVYRENQCELLIQVGDFGFLWTGQNHCEAWPEDIKVWFLPGNHEDWVQLDRLEAWGEKPAENVRYLGRVNRFTLGKTSFLTVGGAFSVDKNLRKVGVSWFYQETISEADIYRAVYGGPVDVVLSHDAPSSDALIARLSVFDLPRKLDEESRQNRRALECILDEVKPKLLIHGHYHYRYTGMWKEVVVQGLDCDGSHTDSWVVLDV